MTVAVLFGFLALVFAGSGGPAGQDRESDIAALHRRSAAVAPGSAEARAISAEMGRIASALLADGKIGPALELLGEAYGLDQGNGRVLAELTLAYVRSGDLDSARFYLARVGGGAEGASSETYRSLGEEYESLQRLDDAAAAWSEAARLSGQDPATLARLSRVRDELAVSRGQRTLSTDHFELFADPEISEDAVRTAADGLESAYARMVSALPTRLARTQVVVLHSGRAYFSLVSVPDWAGGVFDGKIRVSMEPGSGDAAASSAVLTHELAHAVLRQTAGDRAPGWLHEGYAQWSAGRRLPRREIHSVLGEKPAASASALEASLRGPLDRRGARSAYAQTLSLVELIVETRGEGALTCLIARLGDGASIDEALVQETGWTLEELFGRWEKWALR